MLVHPVTRPPTYYSKDQSMELGRLAFMEWFGNTLRSKYPSKQLASGRLDFKALKAIQLAPPGSTNIVVYVPYKKYLHAVEIEIIRIGDQTSYIALIKRLWKSSLASGANKSSTAHSQRLFTHAENHLDFRIRVIVAS